MERTKEEKHKDIKTAIDTMRLLIGRLEDQTITSLERADGMTTIILALILKVRTQYKGGDIFIEHIKSHLDPGQDVICKICGDKADHIIREGIKKVGLKP